MILIRLDVFLALFFFFEVQPPFVGKTKKPSWKEGFGFYTEVRVQSVKRQAPLLQERFGVVVFA
jgi:hypothetical protein